MEVNNCSRGILEICCIFPSLLMDHIAIPVNVILQGTSEPSGVLNLFYNIFLFTSYFNWRGAPRGSAWDQIRLIPFKETDMENWVDLVVPRQLQMIGAVVDLL